ncbi:DUF4054 domain-containing protein [Acetobacter okinawensis]|nr:DUF4054 domain-containing protein [Acetobacter okinawensis]MCP1212308.1 DUF4054 domain-containing protein [Acetobacter okinawensis]
MGGNLTLESPLTLVIPTERQQCLLYTNQYQVALSDLLKKNLPNTPTSPVRDVGRRTLLLELLVAHIATLFLPQEQGGQGGLVGRVASASRGSVSVTTDYAHPSERAAWFAQTPYGAAFWAATRGLRQARYIPGGPQTPRIWP